MDSGKRRSQTVGHPVHEITHAELRARRRTMPLVSEKQLRRYPITPTVMRSTARICTKNSITCSVTDGYDCYQNAMARW